MKKFFFALILCFTVSLAFGAAVIQNPYVTNSTANADAHVERIPVSTNIIFYVAPWGNDANSGLSPYVPLATPHQAAAIATNFGSSVYFMAGTNVNELAFTNRIQLANGVSFDSDPSSIIVLTNWQGSAGGAYFRPAPNAYNGRLHLKFLSATNGINSVFGYYNSPAFPSPDKIALTNSVTENLFIESQAQALHCEGWTNQIDIRVQRLQVISAGLSVEFKNVNAVQGSLTIDYADLTYNNAALTPSPARTGCMIVGQALGSIIVKGGIFHYYETANNRAFTNSCAIRLAASNSGTNYFSNIQFDGVGITNNDSVNGSADLIDDGFSGKSIALYGCYRTDGAIVTEISTLTPSGTGMTVQGVGTTQTTISQGTLFNGVFVGNGAGLTNLPGGGSSTNDWTWVNQIWTNNVAWTNTTGKTVGISASAICGSSIIGGATASGIIWAITSGSDASTNIASLVMSTTGTTTVTATYAFPFFDVLPGQTVLFTNLSSGTTGSATTIGGKYAYMTGSGGSSSSGGTNFSGIVVTNVAQVGSLSQTDATKTNTWAGVMIVTNVNNLLGGQFITPQTNTTFFNPTFSGSVAGLGNVITNDGASMTYTGAVINLPFGVYVKVPLNTFNGPNNGGIANTNTGRFTLNVDGYYLVTAAANFTPHSPSTIFQAFTLIYTNGVVFDDASLFGTTYAFPHEVIYSATSYFKAGDYLEMYSYGFSADFGGSTNDPASRLPKMTVNFISK